MNVVERVLLSPHGSGMWLLARSLGLEVLSAAVTVTAGRSEVVSGEVLAKGSMVGNSRYFRCFARGLGFRVFVELIVPFGEPKERRKPIIRHNQGLGRIRNVQHRLVEVHV